MGKKKSEKKASKFPKTLYAFHDPNGGDDGADYVLNDVDQSNAIREAIGDDKAAFIATYELVRVERATLQAKLEPIGKKKKPADDI